MSEALFEIHDVTKVFPGTTALDNVSFDLLAGEVHAVVGENGAGKSTMMNIISGVLQPTHGDVRINNQKVYLAGPKDAQELGIGTVFQELSLIPGLSIAENIFPNRAPAFWGSVIKWGEMYEQAQKMLDEFELHVDPRTLVRNVDITSRQIVEIVKALSLNAQILLMDEPTSALTPDEVDILFGVIRRLKQQGIGIVYISHRIPEIMEIADRVTVLRDGKKVGTYHIEDVTPDQIIELMVGRAIDDIYPSRGTHKSTTPLLEVTNLSSTAFHDISFTLQRGEILGIAGILGAGRSELLKALCGIEQITSGTVKLRGETTAFQSPRAAFDSGVAYMPEERKSEGLFLDISLEQNISVTDLTKYAQFGLMNRRRESEVAQAFVERLAIRTPNVRQTVGRLSGGNQQKVMLSKWLDRNPELLIIDEPTKGVDVGAKVEIYNVLRGLAEDGLGVIFISSELPEIIGLSDRILVMHKGYMVGEVQPDAVSEGDLLALASGYDIERESK